MLGAEPPPREIEGFAVNDGPGEAALPSGDTKLPGNESAATARARTVLLLYLLSAVTLSLAFWWTSDILAQLHPRPQTAPPRFTGYALWMSLQALIVAGVGSLGLRYGPKVGLGAPDLVAVFETGPARQPPPWRSMGIGGLWGLAGGCALTAIAAVLPEPRSTLEIVPPAWWKAILASASAGVNEEIVFRLGIMTLVVAAVRRFAFKGVAATAPYWIGNGVASLLFGMLHLPQAFRVAPEGGPLIVVSVVGLNAAVGILFGWIYWKRGLVAAMASHFATDLILHVVAPQIMPE